MSKQVKHCPTGQKFVFVYCDGNTHQGISMSNEFVFNNDISQKFDDQLVSLFSNYWLSQLRIYELKQN